MSNSFNAGPGELSYDDDRVRANASCCDCGRRFWKDRDDYGDRCDACADASWMREKDRRRQQMAARVEAEVERLQAVKG